MSNPSPTRAGTSPWTPLAHPLFRSMWIALLISHTGTWMHDMSSGWLMTRLTHSSLEVALVQTAFTLPFFFLALPAGTLADIVDRRRFLMGALCCNCAVTIVLGVLTITGHVTPWTLLFLTFCLGVGNAMIGPAWSASLPDFVPKEELRGAVTLNAMSMNFARATGPILAGYVILASGPGVVYFVNAVTFLVLFTAIFRWQPAPRVAAVSLPVERMFEGMRAGLRFARHEPRLRAVLIKGVTISLFVGVTWALLPVLGVRHLGLDAHSYGYLAATIGMGAVAGALVMPRLHNRFSRNAIVGGSAATLAATLVAITLTSNVMAVAAILVVNGAAWLGFFSTLSVAAQLSVPDWVRARGLSLMMLSFFGSLAFGSALWGRIADHYGLETAFLAAAAGIVASLLLTARIRVRDDHHVDQMATIQFPLPEFADDIEADRGPVMVSIRYEIQLDKQPEFFSLMQEMRRIRLRDGAFFWELFSDPLEPVRITEVFMIGSWLDRLRQHHRFTVADDAVRMRIRAMHSGPEMPRPIYLIAGRGRNPESITAISRVQEI